MIHKLTPQVWFGDARSPREARHQVTSIINVAHVIRRKWDYDINVIDRYAIYFRLPRADREEWDDDYFEELLEICEMIVFKKWLPVLTHCQFGGHRGPSVAILMAWIMAGKTKLSLDALDRKAWELTGKAPKTDHGRGRFYCQIMQEMMERSVP